MLSLLVVLGLVLANGFFVATEFAIVAVRRSRLAQMAEEGRAEARAAQQVVGRLDTYIAACQLGITMASLALGWIGEPAVGHLLEPVLHGLADKVAPAAAEGIAVGVSFALITALHIVAGELAPKGLALQKPESTALWVARPMLLFELVFRWPIQLLNGVGNGVLRLFGLHPASGHEMVHSVEELRVLVRATEQAGGVEESEARIAQRAFTFADLTAGALMTPRTEMEALPLDASAETVRRCVDTAGHLLLPVYRDTLDTIVGTLSVVDYYRRLPAAGAPDLESLLRPPMVVPQSKAADDILEEMRISGIHFAVVIDEYGGTAGILTLDDLLEALVGPIRGAPLAASGEPGHVPAGDRQSDGSLLVDGLTRLEEWEELTGTRLAPADHDLVETVGGLVLDRLGRIAAPGDEVDIAGRRVRVEAMDGLRIATLRVGGTEDALPVGNGAATAPPGEKGTGT